MKQPTNIPNNTRLATNEDITVEVDCELSATMVEGVVVAGVNG